MFTQLDITFELYKNWPDVLPVLVPSPRHSTVTSKLARIPSDMYAVPRPVTIEDARRATEDLVGIIQVSGTRMGLARPGSGVNCRSVVSHTSWIGNHI